MAGAAARVEVEFVGADGAVRREPLAGCWNVAFERVAPVRRFPSFRGQRNRPGTSRMGWCAPQAPALSAGPAACLSHIRLAWRQPAY
jgi:hypothetical protein